jgi:hypothetical protein
MSARGQRPLRVAFDMDGVIADLKSALVRQSAALFGEAAGAGQTGLTKSRRRRLWNSAQSTENFWETLDETEPGGVSRLAALVAERRWETIFLTTRPETAGDGAQVQTQRWLAARGFPCPSVFVVRRSRGVIAAALELDVVVDDRPENCLDVVSDSTARAILTWRRTADPPGIVLNRGRIDLVSRFGESLDLLTEMDVSRRQPASRLSGFLHTFRARLVPAI